MASPMKRPHLPDEPSGLRVRESVLIEDESDPLRVSTQHRPCEGDYVGEWTVYPNGSRTSVGHWSSTHQVRPDGSINEFDQLIRRAGLEPVASSTFGFGPFTLFRRKLLPKRLALLIDSWLQRLADKGVPGLRSVGAQNVVLARLNTSRRGKTWST
jgi:hypothetical protein